MRSFSPLILSILCMTESASLHATEADYLSHEGPLPDSVLEMQGSFELVEEVALTRSARLADTLWDKASLAIKPRSYYLNKQRDGAMDSLAWTAGGSLEYQSGLHQDRLLLGAVLYTSQRLSGPADKDGTLLLRPGQESFTVVGEANLTARLTDQVDARLYRQTFHLPYVNRQDNRMAPNTFEAYSVYNQDPDSRLHWVTGHITGIKKRNSSSFESMAKAAGADDANDGMSMAGGRYHFTEHIDVGAINYRGWDVMNTLYTEANAAWSLGDGFAARLSGQYTWQKSHGEELIGDFDTDVYGLQLSMSYHNAVFTLAHTSTDNDSNIQSPWGGYPGYASVIIQDFNRAGEDAWLLGLSWNGGRLGLEGLTLFTNYVTGETPDSGSAASPDQQELDLTADYYFQGGGAKGLWLRARAAFLDQEGPGAIDQQDFRIILNYRMPLH
jgi:hypothetical protein